jgi:hypothetical protein
MTDNRKNVLPSLFLSVFIAMTQSAFAQSKACKDEKNKANVMKNNCIEMNKSKGQADFNFNKCLEGLKVQVAKANKICEADNQKLTASPAKPPASKVASGLKSTKIASNPKPAVAEVVKKKDPVYSVEEIKTSPVKAEESENNETIETKKLENNENNETIEAEESEYNENNETIEPEESEYSESYKYKQFSQNNKKANEIRYGARVNLGISGVYPSLLQFATGQERYVESGVSYGLGGFAIIPAISSFHFVPEISIQHRKPIKIYTEADNFNLTITETAIEIPLMFRFLYSEDNLIYLEAGIFVGMALDLTEDPPSGTEGIKEFRSKDYGLVLGFGFSINDNFSVDARGTASAASFGIGEYLGASDIPHLIQAQIGASYVF